MRFLIVVLLPFTSALAQAADGGPYVAVVEDAIENSAGEEAHTPSIHVAFERSGSKWVAVTQPPAPLRWSVCLDGRRTGQLSSSKKQLDHQALEPVAGQPSPFVGKRSTQFAGWKGGKVYRPLVMSSALRCGDPEHWRPKPPPAQLVAKLLPALRAETKDIYDCQVDGSPKPYAFSDADVAAGKSYVSDSGTRIVSLSVRPPRELAARCGVIDGPGWAPHTFVVFPSGEVAHLGADLRVLDAGDYDEDGRSEVVFQVGGYNHDGYLLGYDSLRQTVEFGWSYH